MSYVGLPCTVVGVVLDDDIFPVEGARVWVVETPVRFETRTDQNGFFRLTLPSLGSGDEPDSAWFDGYRLDFAAEGMVEIRRYPRVVYPLPDPIPHHLRAVILAPAVTKLRGVVRDADGTPIAGAELEFEGPKTRTGPDGRFGPLLAPAGFHTSSARAPGLAGECSVLLLPGCPDETLVEVPVVAVGE